LLERIIVFAPHPNDETFGCGGTIAKKIKEGYEVLIVLLTDGRNLLHAVLGIESDPSPEEVRKIRREEVMRATKILGVPNKNLLFLDFDDGSLKEHEEEVVERITKILEEYSPVEIYVPYIKDSHPDHKATNRIVRRCVQKSNLIFTIYQYPGMNKYARIGPLVEMVRNLFIKDKIKFDISEFLDLKKKAITEFNSELSVISKKQKKPFINKLNRYLKKKETFHIMRTNKI